MNLACRLEPVPGIVTRRIAGETILVPVCSRAREVALLTLNEVGTFVWERLDGRRTLLDLAGEVAAAFEVDAERASSDLVAFAAQLVDAACAREAAA